MRCMGTDVLWTGRFEFELNSGRGFTVATVDVSVRIDIVSFCIGNRILAVAEREHLHDWLQQPHERLTMDDVQWSTIGGDLAFAVDGSIPYILDQDTARSLADRI
jgi:hypothetical protein